MKKIKTKIKNKKNKKSSEVVMDFRQNIKIIWTILDNFQWFVTPSIIMFMSFKCIVESFTKNIMNKINLKYNHNICNKKEIKSLVYAGKSKIEVRWELLQIMIENKNEIHYRNQDKRKMYWKIRSQ